MARRRILHLAVIFSIMLSMIGVFPAAVSADTPVFSQTSVTFDADISDVDVDPFEVNTQAPEQQITVTNENGGALRFISFAVVGPNASDFLVDGSPCIQGNDYATGQQCTFGVSFIPTDTGVRDATLRVRTRKVSTGVEEVTEIPLNGSGRLPTVNITFSPAGLTFPDTQIGSNSPQETVVIRNNSANDITFSGPGAFFITGPASNAFDINAPSPGTCLIGGGPFTLSAGNSCTVRLRFSPGGQNEGPRNGALAIIYDVPGPAGPVARSVPLNGIARKAQASASPSPAVFADAAIGGGSSFRVVEFKNEGIGSVDVVGIGLAGSQAANFAVETTNCQFTSIAPNDTCQALVRFSPGGVGPFTAILRFVYEGVNSDVQGVPAEAILEAEGVNAPQPTAEIVPAEENFGTVIIGQQSGPRLFTFRNNGAVPVTIAAAPAINPNDGNFIVVGPVDCFVGRTLQPTESCEIFVRFNPQPPAAIKTNFLTVQLQGGNFVTAVLRGRATEANLEVTPLYHDFGARQINQPNIVEQAITVTNRLYNSVGPLTVNLFEDVTQFDVDTNDCTTRTLSINTSCTIYVRFQPTVAGAHELEVQIDTAGAGIPGDIIVYMIGTGVEPGLTITPAPGSEINFGTLPIGATGPITPITVTNNSAAPITITVAETDAGGNFGTDFSQCNGKTLAIGQSCQIFVRFTPQGPPGEKFGNVIIDSVDITGVYTINLRGIATRQMLTITTPATPGELDFGPRQIDLAQPSDEKVITVTNNSGADITNLTVNELGPDGGQFITDDQCPGTLPKDQSCTIRVRFQPTSTGDKLARVEIDGDNIPGEYTIYLLGTGVEPFLEITGPTIVNNEIDFGARPVGSVSERQQIIVRNTSQGSLEIDVDELGPNDDQFLVQENLCDGKTLATGESCTIYVRFRPTAIGEQRARVAIDVTDPDNLTGRYIVGLVGRGIEPQLQITGPTNGDLVFDPRPVGTISGQQTITITNPVGNDSDLGPLTIPIDDAGGNFTINRSQCQGRTLAAGESCTIVVRFAPIAAGDHIGFVRVTSADISGNYTIYLFGTGTQPQITVSPIVVSFDDQQVGTTSPTKTVTVTNTSGQSITLDPLVPTTSQYLISADQCSNRLLTPSGPQSSCTFEVSFRPALDGVQDGEITINGIVTGGGTLPTPYVVRLEGRGVYPQVNITPNTLVFAPQQLNTTSAPQELTIQNLGIAPIIVRQVLPSNAFFLVNDNQCQDKTLAPQATCIVVIQFQPTDYNGGNQSSDIVVDYESGTYAATSQITISGIVFTPQVSASPQEVNFGNQPVGETSSPRTVTLKNNTGGAITVTGISLPAGPGLFNGDYGLRNNFCQNGGNATTLAPGAECSVDVVFTPSDQGQRPAILRFETNTAGSPHDVPLNGNGVFAVAVFEASAVDFGNQQLNTTSAAQTVKVTNKGPGQMLINGVSIVGINPGDAPGDFFIFFNNGCAGTLAPNQACEIQVKFRPTALGQRIAYLRFDTNAAGNPNLVPLRGNGTPEPQYTVTVNVAGNGCTAAIAPMGPYQGNETVTLTVNYNPATTIFIGWTLDGNYVGYASPLDFNVAGSSHNVLATCVPRPGFSDVNAGTPYNEAIIQLAARGVIKGFGNGNFGPNDGIVRAQMAAITVRLAGWSNITKQNIFSDRCNATGCVDDELWNSVAVTAFFQVARGYEDNTYRPFDPVANIQAVAFITRTMVKLGLWEFQPDNPAIYPNILVGTGHRIDISTYYFYAGAVPGTNAANPWPQWDQPATRAYFAGIYWQAYASYYGVDRVP
jgi:hypothetical protein